MTGDAERIERMQVMNRRRFMATTAATAAAFAAGGVGSATSISSDLDFASELVQNPRGLGTVTVRRHMEGFNELDSVPS